MPVKGRPRRSEREEFYEDPMYAELRARIGAALRRLRAERGWTQEQVADRCGMSHAVYHPIEHGTANITLVTLARLVNAFGVDPAELLAPTKRPRSSR